MIAPNTVSWKHRFLCVGMIIQTYPTGYDLEYFVNDTWQNYRDSDNSRWIAGSNKVTTTDVWGTLEKLNVIASCAWTIWYSFHECSYVRSILDWSVMKTFTLFVIWYDMFLPPCNGPWLMAIDLDKWSKPDEAIWWGIFIRYTTVHAEGCDAWMNKSGYWFHCSMRTSFVCKKQLHIRCPEPMLIWVACWV